MEFVVVAGIILAFASAFFSQYIASARGHKSLAFFWVGLLLPGVGIIIAFVSPPPVVAQPMSSTGRGGALVDDLDHLGRLHQTGVLTDDEFDAAKRRLLQGDAG